MVAFTATLLSLIYKATATLWAGCAGIKPQEVNFVITNCSLFNPVPSLSAAVINHFKMGHRTRGFALVRMLAC
jgi:hypothetical protein